MHWILQNNLYSEEGFESLTNALQRLALSYSVHKCVPFIGTLEPEANPPPGKVVVMGSYTLANHAKERGWTPGAWLDNLDFRVQRDHWDTYMLNADAWVGPLGQAYPYRELPFFVRPVHDTKSFTGQVFYEAQWRQFRDNVLALTPDDKATLTGDTEVMVCTKKEIYSETRTWIVKGEVITASGYKLGTLKRYTTPEQVDERLTNFAQDMADIWCPNDAFVLDVADTPSGLKIVEINNLNSAGFYKADMNKLVQAIETSF